MYQLGRRRQAKDGASRPTQSRSTRWSRFRAELGRNAALFLLALPGMLHVIVFQYLTLPFLVIAFQDYRHVDGILGSKWVGLKNFEFLFGGGGKGWEITRNVILYNAAFIVLGTVLALTVAILLAEVHKSLASRFYQTALFFPQFISWVIIAYFGYALLHTQNGMLNSLLSALGQEPVDWYRQPQYWPVILVISSVYRGLGAGAAMYLAGILRINPEYFEAAQVDGANKWQQIRYITLPSLAPLVTILVLLAIGGIFRADFGLFYQMPRQYANPILIRTTDVIDTYVFRALREGGQLKLATAAGLYQSVVGFVLVVTANWVVRKIDPDRSLF